MFASLMSFANRTMSDLNKAANCSGFEMNGWSPWLLSNSTTSGKARILAISPEMLSMMYFGVPAGANIPVQPDISNAGKPASAMVGTWGKGAERVSPDMASGLSRPLLM